MVKIYQEPTNLEEAQRILKEIKLDLTNLQTQLTQTESERDQKEKEWQDLNTKFEELKRKKTNSHSPSIPSSSELTSLKQQLKNKEEENTRLDDTIKQAQVNIANLFKEKTALEKQVKDLQAKKEDSKEESVKVKPDFDWQTPAVYLSGFLIVLLTWSWLKTKILGK